MSWRDFLSQLGGGTAVTLVGPLHDAAVEPLEPTVYVDGGARFRKDSKNVPAISIGDGDSGSAALDVKLPAEKDYSDLAFVLRELPRSVVELRLVGFLGERLDHELANLGELHRFLSTREGTVEMVKGKHVKVIGFSKKFDGEVFGTFSLMVLESTEIKIAGAAKYLLAKPTRLDPASSFALSNSGNGRIQVECLKPCFLFLQA